MFNKNNKNNKNNIKKEKDKKKDKTSFFSFIRKHIPLSKVAGRILIIYLMLIIIAGIFLMIPGVIIKNENNFKYYWNYIVAIFNASSALTDTGLAVAQVNTTYTIWGQIILLLLIQVGGIGVITIKIAIIVSLNKKVSIYDQIIAQSERGGTPLTNTVEMIKDAFIFLIIIEIFGMILLFFGFYYIDVSNKESMEGLTIPYNNFNASIWSALFHSISATNNAGFDLISGNSLQPYDTNSKSYYIQTIFMLQWIIGGLGYPTYYDVKRKIKAIKTKDVVHFSLFTKLNFTIYMFLLIIGPLLIWITESCFNKSEILAQSFDKAFFNIVFNITSSRNAGFSTVDLNKFAPSSRIVFSIWMFIGSAPSSTAGGIRTTTFAILILSLFATLRNKKSVHAFKKRISNSNVTKAHIVFFLSLILVVIGSLIVYADSYDKIANLEGKEAANFVNILLLITSAFGTVGLSPYSTDTLFNLNVISLLLIIFIMFIGQLGISNALISFIRPESKELTSYVEENVTIG